MASYIQWIQIAGSRKKYEDAENGEWEFEKLTPDVHFCNEKSRIY